MPEFLKEFIITLKDRKDLDPFYQEMEGSSGSEFVPSRAVTCAGRRPISRNTHYLLTVEEAELLRQDPRVESVLLKPKEVKTEMHAAQTAAFHRGATTAVGQKNWGLYRAGLESNISGWGDGSNVEQTATINITGSGKNVDVVVVDEIAYPNHSEYSSRFNQYNWFSLDQTVRGTGATLATVARSSNTVTVTTATAHGLSDGAIVNVVCTSQPSFNATGVTITLLPSGDTTSTFRYSQVGADVTQTSATGYWRGVYVYDNYSGSNNHASHVTGIIAGNTQGWARDSNIYNLRHDAYGGDAGAYTPPEYLIDYIRAWHAQKSINPTIGRKNPTIVNCSWGMGVDLYGINNPFTGGLYSVVSKLNYRGAEVTAASLLGSAIEDVGANTPHDTGYSGVCNTSTRLQTLSTFQAGNRIETSSSTIATVSSISLNMGGRASLTLQGAPFNSDPFGYDANDDAVWRLTPPWLVTYLGATYGTGGTGGTYIFVSSNGGVFFGGSGYTGTEAGAGSPNVRKIWISGGDRSCQRLYVGTEGVAPNRTWRIRWEGHDAATGGAVNSPTILWEMTFYEATTNRIDLHVDQNAAYRGEFTPSQLAYYGITQEGTKIPYRNSSIDADIADAISEGIIFVSSAGNNFFKIDSSGGQDYNNSYVNNGITYYYHRGSTPGGSHSDMITVGGLSSSAGEYKIQSSNAGPKVDLYAPGENVISSVYNSLGDTGGASTVVVNSGQASLSISSIARNGSNVATITTSGAHDLVTGDIVTVACTTDNTFDTYSTAITVTGFNTFTYTNSGSTLSTTSGTGTITVGNLYQKYNGSSMAAAQVTGMLAVALETYPHWNQSQAKTYLMGYAKANKMTVTTGGYDDRTSLQGGANRVLYYFKERPSDGNIYPKINYQVRPSSGMVFPRNRIRRY